MYGCTTVRQLSCLFIPMTLLDQMVKSLNVVVYKCRFCLHSLFCTFVRGNDYNGIFFQTWLIVYILYSLLQLLDILGNRTLCLLALLDLVSVSSLLFCLSCSFLHSLFHPHPHPSANMSLEHNGTVLIKRVVCTKAKSPDNVMFSIRLKLILLSVIGQLRLKLKIVIMNDIKTE